MMRNSETISHSLDYQRDEVLIPNSQDKSPFREEKNVIYDVEQNKKNLFMASNSHTASSKFAVNQGKKKKRRIKNKLKRQHQRSVKETNVQLQTDEQARTENEIGNVINRDKIEEIDNNLSKICIGNDQINLLKAKPHEVALSPRKQTIMRYRKSDDEINESSFINEIKGSLKTKAGSNNKSEKSKEVKETSYDFDKNLNLDEKVTLFKYKSSNILVFHEQLSESKVKSSGSLLAHGDFEVFQLHNGNVSYLSCGPTFIYPLLPKLRILRINFNQFILPLVNPERYWKIFINSDDSNVISILENTFKKVVTYRNLYFENDMNSSKEKPELQSINEIPEELKSSSARGDDALDSNPLYFPYPSVSDEIPDSPPSVPISPHQQHNINNSKPPSPLKKHQLDSNWNLLKKKSELPFTSAVASFSNNSTFKSSEISPALLKQPIPLPIGSHSSLSKIMPYQTDQSESSTDSLLDEYEENISVTKSMNMSRSRLQSGQLSKTMSITSSSALKKGVYTEVSRIKGQFSDFSEEFPTTSLSEYNRIHNLETSKSRRSSRSELYISESNWMEPNRITHQNYRWANNQNIDLNNTYRNIYSSISQRNLHSLLGDESGSKKSNVNSPKPIRSVLDNIKNHSSLTNSNSIGDQRLSGNNKIRTQLDTNAKNMRTSINQNDIHLDTSQIYKYIKSTSTRPDDERAKIKSTSSNRSSFASRIFGW